YAGAIVSRAVSSVPGTFLWRVSDSANVASSVGPAQLVFQIGDGVDAQLGPSGFALTSAQSTRSVIVEFDSPLTCEALSAVFGDSAIGGWTFPAFAQAEPSTTIICDMGLRRSVDWTLEIQ